MATLLTRTSVRASCATRLLTASGLNRVSFATVFGTTSQWRFRGYGPSRVMVMVCAPARFAKRVASTVPRAPPAWETVMVVTPGLVITALTAWTWSRFLG